jgi:hypothetical protein
LCNDNYQDSSGVLSLIWLCNDGFCIFILPAIWELGLTSYFWELTTILPKIITSECVRICNTKCILISSRFVVMDFRSTIFEICYELFWKPIIEWVLSQIIKLHRHISICATWSNPHINCNNNLSRWVWLVPYNNEILNVIYWVDLGNFLFTKFNYLSMGNNKIGFNYQINWKKFRS